MNKLMVSVKPTLQANLPESVLSGHRGIVALRFRVLKDGTIQNDVVTIEKSSGRGDMDEAAVAAIRTAARFQPFARGISRSRYGSTLRGFLQHQTGR